MAERIRFGEKGFELKKKESMGKGGKDVGDSEENMAAWLLGVNNLKIQPFKLPPLGTAFLI